MATYADRPWVKHYDSGVPASLGPYPSQPLYQSLRDIAATLPEAVALVTSAHVPLFGRLANEMTYAELNRQSDELAAALQALGVKRGDRVAIVMPNVAAFVVSFYAVLKAGGVVAAMNPTFPAEKLQWYLDDCDAKVAIVMSLFYDSVKSVQSRTQIESLIVTNVKEYLPAIAATLFSLAKEKKGGHRISALGERDVWLQDLLRQYAGQKPTGEVTGDDLAIFQYTGGTTGIAKAAMSTHRALVVNTLQCKTWLLGDQQNGANEVFLGAIPMFHVFGMVAVLSFAMSMGARIILVPNARDLNDVLDVIDVFKPTLFNGVPALYNALNEHPDVKSGKRSLRSINLCVSGSAPLPPAVKRRFEELCNGTLLEGFGMSEAPTATHCNPARGENRTGSIGLPFPDVEVCIVSLEDGITEVPVGETGELLISGPQLMVGYHKMEDETAIALRKLGGKTWLYTGDIARMDEDGYCYIIDRKKDMVIIGGFNVYPTNVEKILAEHPAVHEVAVAGVPHPDKPGLETLKAWVVLREGQTTTADELISHAQKYLAHYELPRRITFVDSLPKTAVGKTLRRELVAGEQMPTTT
jgi:long-chain acyl-CoA synthetase